MEITGNASHTPSLSHVTCDQVEARLCHGWSRDDRQQRGQRGKGQGKTDRGTGLLQRGSEVRGQAHRGECNIVTRYKLVTRLMCCSATRCVCVTPPSATRTTRAPPPPCSPAASPSLSQLPLSCLPWPHFCDRNKNKVKILMDK